MSSNFMAGIANDIYSLLPLDQLLTGLDDPDPDWSFQPYSTSVRLANGIKQGNGFPIIQWRWNIMDDIDREILRAMIAPNLSGPVFIRTATNEVDIYGAIVFKTYSCIMNWTDTDEDLQADKVQHLLLTFTHAVEVTE